MKVVKQKFNGGSGNFSNGQFVGVKMFSYEVRFFIGINFGESATVQLLTDEFSQLQAES